MALFKQLRGNRASLDAQPLHDGYAYFCTDDGTFHIDYADADGNLHRKQINAKEAEKLAGYDISTIINSSDVEIPTSKAVKTYVDNAAEIFVAEYDTTEFTDIQSAFFDDNKMVVCMIDNSPDYYYLPMTHIDPDGPVASFSAIIDGICYNARLENDFDWSVTETSVGSGSGGGGVDPSALFTVDKINEVDAYYNDVYGLSASDDGITWEDSIAFGDEEGNYHVVPAYLKTPIVAGDNITFTENGGTVAISAPGVGTAVSAHNTNTSAHADIREQISQLSSEKDDLTERVDELEQDVISIQAENLQQTPLYANNIEECTDTSKMYVLPDGLIYAYIKTITVGGAGYTDLVPTSTDTDGSTFNDTGYQDNVRLSSSGGISGTALPGSVTTGFMPYSSLGVVRMKGATWDMSSGLLYIIAYDSSKTKLFACVASAAGGGTTYKGMSVVYDAASGVTTFDFTGGSAGAEWYDAFKNAAYIRLNAMGKGADLIVTVNQEIKESAPTETYQWVSTGHAFVPADYEDRINELEEESTENTLAVTELKQQMNDILDGTTEIAASTKFDPAIYSNGNFHYYLPVLHLTGDISPIAVSKDNKVTLSYIYGERNGSCTLKAQGNTSYSIAQNLGKYGKYNYTITFDNAFEACDGWGEQKKYCLKANWNDPSHARNVVSAKLWGLMAESRTGVPTKMASLPNAGAIDGFPCIIMLNGEFHGLYTFNIPKDEWMFGFGSGTKEAFISADNPANDTLFKGETLLDADGMELEYSSDSFSETEVKDSLNTLINACANTTGGDLDTTVAQYLDWASAIDMYILVAVMRGADNVGKNYLMATYDGTKWYLVPYDMDLTWGTEYGWTKVCRPVSNVDFVSLASDNRIYELIKRFKTDALKTRYNELRANVLSESRIVQYFENFGLGIPLPVMIEDMKLYPSIPGSSVCNIDQICRWVGQRLETCDKWVNEL